MNENEINWIKIYYNSKVAYYFHSPFDLFLNQWWMNGGSNSRWPSTKPNFPFFSALPNELKEESWFVAAFAAPAIIKEKFTFLYWRRALPEFEFDFTSLLRCWGMKFHSKLITHNTKPTVRSKVKSNNTSKIRELNKNQKFYLYKSKLSLLLTVKPLIK